MFGKEYFEREFKADNDGVDVTLEEIQGWKKGNMRQQDYTRKTQELANQKKDFELLKATGIDVDAEPKANDIQRIERLEFEEASRKLDIEITSLKTKYPDFDEIAVLNEAEKRGIYTDYEFVYKALRAESKPDSIVNVDVIKNQAIEEYKSRIAQELLDDTKATGGSIISSEAGAPTTDYADMLTSDEKTYCGRRGWSFKEYTEMKDNHYL